MATPFVPNLIQDARLVPNPGLIFGDARLVPNPRLIFGDARLVPNLTLSYVRYLTLGILR